MTLPTILSKVKALAPVAVVGGAIAITIKLLSQESTPNSQILKVDAEEDIKTTEFEEQLEEEQPEEEEAPPEEEPKPQANQEANEDSEQQEDEQGEGDSESSDSQEEQDEKKQQSEEDEKEKPKLTFKDGGLGDILKEIFKND